MKASKITHRNMTRIRVDFHYNAQTTAQLRQIPDTRWSKTLKSWHIPYTKEAFEQLKTLFPDVEYPTPHPHLTPNPSPNVGSNLERGAAPKKIELKYQEAETNVAAKSNEISIEITARHIYVKVPKNDADIAFIRSFKFVLWDSKNYCWSVPNYKNTAEKIKAYFNARNPAITELVTAIITEQAPTQPTYTATQLLVINHSDKIFKVYFSFNKNLVFVIKKSHLPNGTMQNIIGRYPSQKNIYPR